MNAFIYSFISPVPRTFGMLDLPAALALATASAMMRLALS